MPVSASIRHVEPRPEGLGVFFLPLSGDMLWRCRNAGPKAAIVSRIVVGQVQESQRLTEGQGRCDFVDCFRFS
jgi:hypothetical protein